MLDEKLMEVLESIQNSIRLVPKEKFISTDKLGMDGCIGNCLSYCNKSCTTSMSMD